MVLGSNIKPTNEQAIREIREEGEEEKGRQSGEVLGSNITTSRQQTEGHLARCGAIQTRVANKDALLRLELGRMLLTRVDHNFASRQALQDSQGRVSTTSRRPTLYYRAVISSLSQRLLYKTNSRAGKAKSFILCDVILWNWN